jgi:hypothetical protein
MTFKSKSVKSKADYLKNIDNDKTNSTTFKSLCIHFTEKEYNMIKTIAKKENRTLINSIKTAIIGYADN